jgi:hypothetical protein
MGDGLASTPSNGFVRSWDWGRERQVRIRGLIWSTRKIKPWTVVFPITLFWSSLVALGFSANGSAGYEAQAKSQSIWVHHSVIV